MEKNSMPCLFQLLATYNKIFFFSLSLFDIVVLSLSMPNAMQESKHSSMFEKVATANDIRPRPYQRATSFTG